MLSLVSIVSSAHEPGRQHVLDADYFARIDAMDYALALDDGQQLQMVAGMNNVYRGTIKMSKDGASQNVVAVTTKLLGADVKQRYAELKQAAADRCPRQLGTFVKTPEVQYHHDVYNQCLWNHF